MESCVGIYCIWTLIQMTFLCNWGTSCILFRCPMFLDYPLCAFAWGHVWNNVSERNAIQVEFYLGGTKKQTMKQKKYPKKVAHLKLFCISRGRGCHSHVDSHPIWQITGRHQKLLHGCSAVWSAREISSVARPCTLTGKNWLPVPVVAQGECKTHGKFEHTTIYID